jgi:hypothetical protein
MRWTDDSRPIHGSSHGGLGGAPPRSLEQLLEDLVEARAEFFAARRLDNEEIVEEAHNRFVASLRTYTAELERRCLPVPYALRDDLRIYGAVLDERGRRRA